MVVEVGEGDRQRAPRQRRVTVNEAGDDLRASSVLISALPADVRPDDLPAVHRLLFGDRKLAWKNYDYYQASPARPHADKAWAPQGIVAEIGESEFYCGLIVRHGDRCSGLIATGRLDQFGNQTVTDSFEILSTAQRGKTKPGMTWREGQTRAKRPLDASGIPLRSVLGRFAAVPWKEAWECETEHYHVTTHVSPARLLEYASLLEGLYKAYVDFFQPDAQPVYKMEVHVFNSRSDFIAGSASLGIPIVDTPGSTTGGFFVPQRLCLVVWEESGKVNRNLPVEKVMAHECSHQFLHMTCNGSDHVPTWINEGIAVSFESGTFEGGRFIVRPPLNRINLLKKMYAERKSTLIPLDQYIDHSGSIQAASYGEVYAMIHFWVFGVTGGKERMRRYCQALRAGDDGAKAFEAIFMADLIKAQGGREKAIQAWQASMLEYVKDRLD